MATLLYEWRAEDISASDNDPIGTWTSHAGGVAFSQAVSGNKPLYKTNVTPSGKAVLRGDGINDSMTSPSITGVVHLFVVGAFRPYSNSSYPELLETDGHDDFLVFAGGLNFAAIGTHYRDGINSLAVYPNGQFAIYEAVRSSPATGVLNLLCNSGGNQGPFDVAYVAAYDAEVTGGALTTIRGALQAAYLNPPPPTITTDPPLADGSTDEAYSVTLDVDGGTGSITWSVSAGSLPTGLSLDASTGEISGTPTTPGTYTFSIIATDDDDVDSDPVEYTIEVTAPPAEPGTTLDEVLLPTDYSADAEGGPEFATAIIGSGDGGIIRWRAETTEDYRSKYDIMYGELSDERRQILRNFAILRKGMARAFRFLAPDDHTLDDELVGEIDEAGELVQVTNAGGKTDFRLIKRYVDVATNYTRRIVKPSPWDEVNIKMTDGSDYVETIDAEENVDESGAIIRYATGTIHSIGYTFDFKTGTLVLDDEAPEGSTISISCVYHLPAAFSEDWLKFKVDVAAISEFRISVEELLPKEIGISA